MNWQSIVMYTLGLRCCLLVQETNHKHNVQYWLHSTFHEKRIGSLWASWFSGSVCDVQVRDCRFDPRLHRTCSDVMLLGKALCSHMHSLDLGVSGYLAGQWRVVCLNSSVCRKRQLGCMLPGKLRWLMNKQLLWWGGNCVKLAEWCFVLDTRL